MYRFGASGKNPLFQQDMNSMITLRDWVPLLACPALFKGTHEQASCPWQPMRTSSPNIPPSHGRISWRASTMPLAEPEKSWWGSDRRPQMCVRGKGGRELMNCPSCGGENRAGRKFYAACGAPVAESQTSKGKRQKSLVLSQFNFAG